ncbi:MAG: hypothetical protein ACK4RG_07755, partial [Fimbriimonadales bacterium]
MKYCDWDTIDQLASEIAALEKAVRNGAGASETELQEAYRRLQTLLRAPVQEMISELVHNSKTAGQIADDFLARLPLILPARTGARTPCSRWIAGAVIDFVYHATDAAREASSELDARLLSALADAQPRSPLGTEELELIDRVRGVLDLDEFLVWYEYVIN